MEQKKNNKIIYISIGIILLIIISIISIIMLNSNSEKKYLEVAKRVFPQMQEVFLDTVDISNDLMKKILYSNEETVKSSNSYKEYVMLIDKYTSLMYKDIEYLKTHNYSKNTQLSNEIKDLIKKFEESMQNHRELKTTSYYGESEKIYTTMQELTNKINRE